MFSHPIRVKIRLTLELHEETNSALKSMSSIQLSKLRLHLLCLYECKYIHYILRVDRWPIQKFFQCYKEYQGYASISKITKKKIHETSIIDVTEFNKLD